MSLRDDLQARYRAKPEKVEADGVEVWVKSMSAADKLDFIEAEHRADRLLVVLRRCVVREDGSPQFKDGDESFLRGLPSEFTTPIWNRAIEMSGFAEPDEGKAGGTPSGGDSPSA